MFEVIATLIANVKIVLLLSFGVATAAGMLFAYVKTRSTPAVLGLAFLGISAIVLVANINTFADKFGGDVLGNESVTVGSVTGVQPTGNVADGDTTATTVCNAEFSTC